MPGILATMLIGGIAAVISWGLYGANAATNATGTATGDHFCTGGRAAHWLQRSPLDDERSG